MENEVGAFVGPRCHNYLSLIEETTIFQTELHAISIETREIWEKNRRIYNV